MDKNKRKAIIYPFTDDVLPLVWYLQVSNVDMVITSLIDIKRRYLNGKDVGYIKNRPDTGMIISDNLEKALNENDILIYTDELCESIGDDVAFKDMEKALQMRKKVICFRDMTECDIKKLNQIALQLKAQFDYPCQTNYEIPEEKLNYIPRELYEPEASVIMVGEMFKGMDGEYICLSLARHMEADGYKCAVITEQKYAKAVNSYPFPSFIRTGDKLESNKVFYMNNFIKYIDETKKPDAIIVLIPDAMIRYNKMFGNGFGIVPYLVSQAVQTDCFIFCSQYDYIKTEFFDLLSTNFENRYGFQIDLIHMSNIMLDIQKSQISGKLSFLCQTWGQLEQTIKEKYQNCKIPVFNGLEQEQCKKMNCCVTEKLKSYAERNLALL